MDHDSSEEDSVRTLIRGILTDMRTLVREEVELAKVELRTQASRARVAAMTMAIAIAGLATGALFVLIAAALGLSEAMAWPFWAGFAAVAAFLVVVGAIAAMVARSKIRAFRPVPEETVSTLKENSAWIATRLSSAQR